MVSISHQKVSKRQLFGKKLQAIAIFKRKWRQTVTIKLTASIFRTSNKRILTSNDSELPFPLQSFFTAIYMYMVYASCSWIGFLFGNRLTKSPFSSAFSCPYQLKKPMNIDSQLGQILSCCVRSEGSDGLNRSILL